jgi:hypothetical protein
MSSIQSLTQLSLRLGQLLSWLTTQMLCQNYWIPFVFSLLTGVSLTLVQKADPNSALAINAIARISYVENGALIAWMQFYRDGGKQGAWSLLPQGLYGKISEY